MTIIKTKIIRNKMELLQSQAPTKRELFRSSVIRTLEFGNWTFDLRMWTLDIEFRHGSLFRASFDGLSASQTPRPRHDLDQT